MPRLCAAIALTIAAAACGSSAPAPGWQPAAPIAGGPRQETGVAELGGKIYVVGGFHSTQGIVATVEAYDPATDRWQTVAPFPTRLHHANVAAARGRLWVVGSLTDESFGASGAVWEYDPGVDRWTPHTAMPAGRERGASAVGFAEIGGGTIFVAGGYRGTSVAQTDAYRIDADRWDPLPDLPEARDHLVGAVAGGTFYAIGGRLGASLRARVDALPVAGGAWSARAAMPTARAGMGGAVASGGRIVVVGGEGNAAVANGVFPQVEVYDSAADAWTALAPMATPRHGMGAAAIGNQVYVPGGGLIEGLGATAIHEVLVLP